MDIRKFVQTQEAALKKYRRTYKLLDFLTILTLFYTLMVVLSIDQALPIIRSFEVRAGTTYDVAGLSIAFETVVLLTISVLVSLVLTFILHRKDKKISTIELVEEKYPSLRERLRTAYDNMSLDNIIANDLKQTVSSTVESVRSSIFLRKKRVNFGLIVLIASVLLLTFVTLNDIHADMTPEDWKGLVDNLPFVPDSSNGDDLVVIDDDPQESTGTENLTGPSAVIVVEGTEVDLSLPPGSGVGFNQGNDTEQDTDFVPSSSYEIDAISSETYYESFPAGYETVIKSYFEKMAEK
jgi:ABC-type multidrug transport system fused ATPase/permease subunit